MKYDLTTGSDGNHTFAHAMMQVVHPAAPLLGLRGSSGAVVALGLAALHAHRGLMLVERTVHSTTLAVERVVGVVTDAVAYETVQVVEAFGVGLRVTIFSQPPVPAQPACG